jgi:hypothetical protein
LANCPKTIIQNCRNQPLRVLAEYGNIYLSRWILSTPHNRQNTAKIKEDKPV